MTIAAQSTLLATACATALPDKPECFIARPGIHASPTQFRVAGRQQERHAAFRLVYKSYLKAGLIKPNRFQMRVTPFHMSPLTHVFVGLQSGHCDCTVSLVQDSKLGLPMEVVYKKEVDRLRRSGHHLAEVSSLAFEPTSARVFWQNFIGLNRLMAQFARFQGVDRLLIAAHPRHARVYQRLMGFEIIGEITSYPTVQNHPAVACCLDFRRADSVPPPTYNHVFDETIPHHQLIARPIPTDERSYLRGFVNSTEAWVPLSTEQQRNVAAICGTNCGSTANNRS